MEKYLEEMEAYKQRKEEESSNPEKEEDEMMKIHKQEALELLKNKEKTKENRQKKKKIADPNKSKKPASSFHIAYFEFGSQEEDIGTISLGILYLSFMVFSFFASLVVRFLGTKNALVLGTTGYWLFVAANLKPTW
ncbi:UNC93-like protein 3 [Camellia lanceoleosa]|uniref:UNC93-like protein 3 n=1 Tax=Camellia lanceoleosa TaxID=1840588 RepID=A0ACC0HRU6_9ERIC|nr:UNC93-like protein 3 [Camellia lanceoleosa]